MAFLNEASILEIGFKSIGKNLLISSDARFYNPSSISIGNNVRIDDFAILSAGDGGIFVGNNVHVACFCGLMGAAEIRLDDFAGLSSRVIIYSSTDDYSGEFMTNPTVPDVFRKVYSAPVILRKHVIIGTNSSILPGVTIGQGSAVGAHSLVAKSLPDSVIATGRPCRIIKPRKVDLFRLEQEYQTNSKE